MQGGAAISSWHPSSLSSTPSAWQPKGAADVSKGGCHGNLNRQSRNELHHQRLTSKLNSTSLTEKRSDGKCLTLRHAPESCPCPRCLSDTGFFSPTEPGDGGHLVFWLGRSQEETMARELPVQPVNKGQGLSAGHFLQKPPTK